MFLTHLYKLAPSRIQTLFPLSVSLCQLYVPHNTFNSLPYCRSVYPCCFTRPHALFCPGTQSYYLFNVFPSTTACRSNSISSIHMILVFPKFIRMSCFLNMLLHCCNNFCSSSLIFTTARASTVQYLLQLFLFKLLSTGHVHHHHHHEKQGAQSTSLFYS